MNIFNLLKQLKERDVSVGVEGEKLKVYDPENNLTPELLQSLKEKKQEIIHFFSNSDELTKSDFPLADLTRELFTEIHAEYTDLQSIMIATPMQSGMIFQSLMDKSNAAYTVQLSGELVGAIDEKAFEAAWLHLIERHEILRTCFVGLGEKRIHQLVRKAAAFSVQYHDLSSYNRTLAYEQLDAIKQADREQGFDLKVPPLMRVQLVKLDTELYQFIWSYHHALLDGWCNPIVIQEVMAFYQGVVNGTLVVLGEPAKYENFIRWLKSRNTDKSKLFWRETLSGLSEAAPLPFLKPAKTLTSHYEKCSFSLSEEQSRNLAQLAQKEKCTVNVLLQFAWAYLLSQYSARQDVHFGVTVSGRPAELVGVENMLGLFINSIPLCVSVDKTSTIRAVLEHIHRTNMECNEHSYLSYSDIQKQSDIPANKPLFESLVIFENYPSDGVTGDDSSVRLTQLNSEEDTNFALTLYASMAEKLEVDLHFQTARISLENVQSVVEYLQQILISLSQVSMEEIISEVSLIPVPKTKAFIAGETKEINAKSGLLAQFEHYVGMTPDKVAVVCDGHAFTYKQLSERINKMANMLHTQGLGAGDLVSVYLPRNIELLTSMLAIQKVGAAYVPLSTNYPIDRIAYMLEHSKAKRVITSGDLALELEICADKVLDLSASNIVTALEGSSVALNNEIQLPAPDDLMYVIYTSGSTGKPKGVCISHNNVANFLHAMEQSPGLSSQDRLLAITPISFDISVLELYLPLYVGATVHIVDEKISKDSGKLVSYIEQNQISCVQATPATWTMLEGQSNWSTVQPIKALCGGEALPLHLATKMVSRYEEVWNMYGPTEATVWVGAHRIDNAGTISIGTPILNTKFHVLNDKLKPVVPGMSGELYISGAGLAKGYLNEPELTTERFLSSPESGELIYKTGDVVRQISNNAYQYLGRVDEQVKVRGYRIELAEVESALIQNELIEFVVVKAVSNGDDFSQLVAYCELTPASNEYDNLDLLQKVKAHLNETLPEYMHPAYFEIIENWPLTPSGKVDKKALPKPEISLALEEYVAPNTDTEHSLVALWSELLKLEPSKISVTSSFFLLGGNSLLLMRLVSRLREQFSVDIELEEAMELSSIRLLAEKVDDYQKSNALSDISKVSDVLAEDEVEEAI